MDRTSNFKYGTPLDRKGLGHWRQVTIEVPMASSSCTMWRTGKHSKMFGSGCSKSKSLQTIMCARCWSATSATSSINGKSVRRRARNWPSTMAYRTWRRQPKATYAWRIVSQRWPARSSKVCSTKASSIHRGLEDNRSMVVDTGCSSRRPAKTTRQHQRKKAAVAEFLIQWRELSLCR